MRMPHRHRLFFWLIDLTTLAVLLAIAMEVGQSAFGFYDLVGDRVSAVLFLIILPIGIFVPLFLAFRTSMRDEFAELCWQRAAATTVKLLFIAPPLVMFGVGVFAGFMEAHGGNPTKAWAGDEVIINIWLMVLTAFILSFQWHRWRVSR